MITNIVYLFSVVFLQAFFYAITPSFGNETLSALLAISSFTAMIYMIMTKKHPYIAGYVFAMLMGALFSNPVTTPENDAGWIYHGYALLATFAGCAIGYTIQGKFKWYWTVSALFFVVALAGLYLMFTSGMSLQFKSAFAVLGIACLLNEKHEKTWLGYPIILATLFAL